MIVRLVFKESLASKENDNHVGEYFEKQALENGYDDAYINLSITNTTFTNMFAPLSIVQNLKDLLCSVQTCWPGRCGYEGRAAGLLVSSFSRPEACT